ncbi:MAG: long-chain fatty acid--CoA ligase [Prosthecobacter sp.]|jgi:acyl-CoA synthetase (AMP-forming)/AMP-acid ligase II|nr:long-chain fatty acid--CoA ligase [Prosthecobacter sp.]
MFLPTHPSSSFLARSSGSESASFLTEPLMKMAQRRPDKPCLYQGQMTTVEKVWERVLRASTWLQRNGVEPGSIVLMALSADHPDAQVLALAVTHAGATVSMLPTHLTQERFQRIVETSEPSCVFLDAGTAEFRGLVDSVLTVWMTSGLNQGEWNEAELDEVFAERPAWGMPFAGKAESPAFLVYDNAGQDQGRVLTHRNLIEMMAGKHPHAPQLAATLPGSQDDLHTDLLHF